LPRKPQTPPPLEVPQLTPDEIARGIARLRKRIDEVKALDPAKIAATDQAVKNCEQNIRTTILEVFGANSLQYRRNEHHQIWDGPLYVNMTYGQSQRGFAAGIPQTVTLLDGLIADLQERLGEHQVDPTSRIRAAFRDLDLHPRIASVAADLYRDGHYRNAVLDASMALVNVVKEKASKHDLDGKPLMQTVFSKNNPVLAFNDLANQTDFDEQEGLMHLFEGAVMAFRNPRAHDLDPDTAEEALEAIAFLSMLAKLLDRAKRTTP
jgi:uncharacterized protein (TIGR02391 family)